MDKYKKQYLTIILMFILIVLFIISSLYIYNWYKDSVNIKKITKEIKDDIEITTNNNFLNVDIKKLKTKNIETVGFIDVKGTLINYPFLQTTNNNYYLTHDFSKNYNEAGWVFLDYRNDIDILDKNTIIYAHGRADRTMFGSLKDTLTPLWFNNLDNHIVRISSLTKNYIWKVFSVYHINTTNDYLKIKFPDNEFQEFIKLIKDRSIYDFNVQIGETDKILTLSTCYNKNEKMVLHAKLIAEDVK